MSLVYIETTIPSYLAARPSRDIQTQSNQLITHQFWPKARNRHTLFISKPVLEEIRDGDASLAEKRYEFVKDLTVLVVSEQVDKLAQMYFRDLRLPPSAKTDALHIAYAVHYRMDYLITWNCRHIANGQTLLKLKELNIRLGLFNPIIATPSILA